MPKKSDAVEQSYAELNRQLNEIVVKLQDPEIAVDDATHYYEQALQLITQLEKYLDQAENRVQVIRAKFKREP